MEGWGGTGWKRCWDGRIKREDGKIKWRRDWDGRVGREVGLDGRPGRVDERCNAITVGR